MKAGRLISLVLLLQQRGSAGAAELAETLEVSVRTVLRDIDTLSAAGVPVWVERGRNGGFRIDPGWGARLAGLTEHEATALMMTDVSRVAAEFGLGADALSGRLKLLASLPKQWRAHAEQVGARLHIDPSDWYRAVESVEHLTAMADAVWQAQTIRVHYQSWRGRNERELEPLGLVLKAGVWYVLARLAGREDVRTYRVANVLALAATGHAFERPARFDLAQTWRDSVQRFERELLQLKAHARVSQLGLERMRNVRMHAMLIGGSARADDWLEVELLLESIEHGARQLVALGPEVIVLEPAALRQQILDLAGSVRALYA